jgi:hypothetical protein
VRVEVPVISFSISTRSRLDAVDLVHRLEGFSPWLLELDRDEWYVRGSLPSSAAVEDVRAVVGAWAADRLVHDVAVDLTSHPGVAAEGPIL